jgi:hypothetical protein
VSLCGLRPDGTLILITSRNVHDAGHCDNVFRETVMATAQLSSLFKGSFGRGFTVRPQWRVVADNESARSPSKCSYLQYFEREQANAEALPSLWSLFGLATQQETALSQLVNKSMLHNSHWYSLAVRLRMDHHQQQNSEQRKLQSSLIRAQLSVRTVVSEEATHENIVKYRARNQQPHPLHANRVEVVSITEAKLPLESPVRLQRQLMDSRQLDFEVLTQIEVPCGTRNVQFQEPFSFGYSISLQSYRYSVFQHHTGDAVDWKLAANGSVATLSDFLVVDQHCQRFDDRASVNQPACMSSFSFSFNEFLSLCPLLGSSHNHRNSSHSEALLFAVQFSARKEFPKLTVIPPDASHGQHVGAALVHVDGQMFATPSLLMNRPIPDISMPYNVITIVSTLFAFILGSLINARNKSRLLKSHTL